MDIRRLMYATGRYPQLKGLTLMPLSVLFFATAAYEAGLFHLPGDAAPHVAGRWFMAAFVLALAASYPIDAWYQKYLGNAPQGIAKSQLWPMLAGVAAVPIGFAIQRSLPFSAPVALVALVVGTFGVRHYPFRRHYLAAAAILFALSLHRVLGVPATAVRPLFDASIGLVLAIVGIGDHLLLMSVLEPVQAYV